MGEYWLFPLRVKGNKMVGLTKIKCSFVLNFTALRITFLGTGTSQGIPIIGSTHPVCMSTDPRDKRLRVSILIEFEGAIMS